MSKMKGKERKSLNKRKAINRNMEKRGKLISLNNNSFIYDSDLDILEIYLGGNTDNSININDLIIIGLDRKNKITNLEFLNANRVLGIPLKILENINSGKILFNKDISEKEGLISLNLNSDNMSQGFILPLNTQPNNMVISV